ncbi:MAG: glycosyltransferase family 2 protein [Calditrichaeota bacterium]|nr:MAG: glycosyltransferase family 2 protein [Calditrichota bacterium]
MKKPKGIIIIPAYNEEQNISSLIPEIKQYAPDLDIVVINDHSSDRTSQIARKLGVMVIDLPCNLGYGGAVQTGFKYAVKSGYDYCIQLDGDGQHDPKSIEDLRKEIENNGADVILGSRFLGSALYKIPALRKIGMALFGKIIKLSTGMQITDPTSGYQALSQKAMRFFANDNYPIDYPDADTLIILNYAGFKIKEIPVIMRQRNFGESMHNNLKAVYYLIKMFLSLLVVFLRGKTYYLRENRA